jgi:2-oxoglutarate ferredoxin oxidoreductase subunit beta
MSYVVMDNRIYGLTKGQFSPTSREDFETSTSPEGTKQSPVNPLALALSAGATFIAQSFASDAMRHTELVQKAIEHDGFGFVNVFSPCVTFNDVDTYDYFRDSLVDVNEDEEFDHDPTDFDQAKDRIMDPDHEFQGILYQDPDSVPYEQRHGIDEDMSDIPEEPPEDSMDLVREFY